MKSHSGYSSCTKCTIKGVYEQHRVCFPGTENTLRTDEGFHLKIDKEHHVRLNVILEKLNFDCVQKFPIDYMHCVLLGVMKQVLNCLVKIRRKPCSLKNNAIRPINDNLKDIRRYLPQEFVRKQRTLTELDHWKATEFRTFLCYTGKAALKNIIPETYFKHFLLLMWGIRILSHSKNCSFNNKCAAELITEFVQQFEPLYGKEQLSYIVHSLLHLANDVKEFGDVNSYSAFKFKNYIQTLKKMVKKASFPIQQILNRLKEKEEYQNTTTSLMFSKVFSVSQSFPNNYCMIKNKIMKISKADNNIVEGHELLNLENVFQYPIQSSCLGIFSTELELCDNMTRQFDITDIENKVVKLPNRKFFIYIPLLHI